MRLMSSRQISSLVILMMCGVAFYVIPTQMEDENRGFMTGASLMPDLAVSLIFVLTLLDLFLSFLTKRLAAAQTGATSSNDMPIGTHQFLAILVVAGAMTIYGSFMVQAGYVLSSAVTVAFLMVCTGGRRPLQIACVAIAASGVIFLGLRFGFGVNINAFPSFAI